MKFTTLCIFTYLCNFCVAQSDTSIAYLAKDGHETSKDSAYTFMKFYRQNAEWHGKEYYSKNSVLKSEGGYADENTKTPTGSFNNYTETGKLDFTALWTNGKLNEATYFYKSGSKKSWVLLDDKGVRLQKGWDESGKEIKDFVVMKDASFKGGLERWKKYLLKNVNSNTAVNAGAPPGEYVVKVAFKINSQGFTTDVKTESVLPECKPCGSEALKLILKSPKWQPAIFQNETD